MSTTNSPTLFFSVGEPSGDLHGGNLIAELLRRQPNWRCTGYGGPKMEAAGCQLHHDLTEHAVMGIGPVVRHIPTLWRLYRQADRFFAEQRPQAVVLIDYPGFNWWIAKAAKRHNVPVFYYGAPQMWAWASWRVAKMRRLAKHVLCKLPFETDWYRQRGCNAHYMGHPYFDETEGQVLDAEFLRQRRDSAGELVALLPGSRTQEVRKNLPLFLQAAQEIHRQSPQTRFAVANFNERHAEWTRQQAAAYDLPLEICVGRTPELIHLSHCCLACSGSVSLELLHHAKPTVISYRSPAWGVWLAKTIFLKTRYITLVNLLADKKPFLEPGEKYDLERASSPEVWFPEHMTSQDRSQSMAEQVLSWIREPKVYRRRKEELEDLRSRYAQSGASRRAAEYILRELSAEEASDSAPRSAAA